MFRSLILLCLLASVTTALALDARDIGRWGCREVIPCGEYRFPCWQPIVWCYPHTLLAGETLYYQQWRLETLLTRARDQLTVGKIADAYESRLKARDIGLWDARLASIVGEIYTKQGHWTEAVMALRLSPHTRLEKTALAEALTHTGWERHERGQAADEMRLWREAVDTNPQNADAHSSLGLAYLSAGDAHRADMHCRLGVELAPQAAFPATCLGILAYATGDLPQAEKDARAALDLSEGSPSALSNLAFVRFDQGDAAGAVKLWEQASAQDSTLAEARAGLALGYWRTGQKDKALNAYKEAADLDRSYLDVDLLPARHYWSANATATAREIVAEMKR